MVDEAKLHNVLRQMGRKYVRGEYKEQWTPECPTTGYCYVVSEVLYHYFAPKGSRPYVMRTDAKKGGVKDTHWFLRDPSGRVIDLTADQFDEPVDYDKGKPAHFSANYISKRGQVLADLLKPPQKNQMQVHRWKYAVA